MNHVVEFARYGLLMEGQPLQGDVGGRGETRPGYFWGTLFEGRQTEPLPNGAYHYPVAVLAPPRNKIRCEVCARSVETVDEFWRKLFETELYWPDRSPEQSLMNLAHTRVFTDDGDTIECPVFVVNPLFYLFRRWDYGMELRKLEADPLGFVSWRSVPAWRPPRQP